MGKIRRKVQPGFFDMLIFRFFFYSLTAVQDGRYMSFDPVLSIGGEKIGYLGGTPIKFLGHWIYVNLDDSATRCMKVS